MRLTFIVAGLTAAVLATAPVHAQNSLTSSQSPPSPNAGSAGAMSANSLPDTADTLTFDRPGADVGTTRVGPAIQPQPARGIVLAPQAPRR